MVQVHPAIYPSNQSKVAVHKYGSKFAELLTVKSHFLFARPHCSIGLSRLCEL